MSESSRSVAFFALVGIFVFILLTAGWMAAVRDLDDRNCFPSLATHEVRCWSAGRLVIRERFHKNGGYRCSPDGEELRWEPRGGVCIEKELP